MAKKKQLTPDDVNFTLNIIGGNKIQKELTDITSRTRELTAQNSDLAAEMERLTRLGQQEGEEFKKLSATFTDNSKAIAENDARVKSLEKELGLTGLTMNQLNSLAKQLKGQMNNTVKALEPEKYAELERKLKDVKQRISDLRGGDSIFRNLGKSVVKMVSGMATFEGVKKLWEGAKKVVGDAIDATQGWGDKWDEINAGMSAAYNSFLRTIATGDWSNLFKNIKKAVKSGVEYQRILDDLTDRRRSYELAEAEAALEMEKQERIFKNANVPLKERIAAVDKYNAEVEKLGATRHSMIDQELNDENGGFKKMLENATKLDAAKVDSFIREYDNQKQLREEAKKYNEDLKKAAEIRYEQTGTTSSKAADSPAVKAAKERVAVAKDSVKKYAEILQGIDATNDEMLDKYVKLQKDLMMVDVQILQDTQRSNQRRENLEKEANNDAIQARQAAMDKEHAQAKLALTKNRTENKISAEQYEQQLYDLEVSYLQRRIDAEKEGSAERVKLEQQLVELDIKTLAKRESENAKILAAREQHFKALQKVSDDYAKSQADKDTAEILAVQQKYDKVFEANITAFEKGVVAKEEFLQREAQLEQMMRDEIAVKSAEQREKSQKEQQEKDEKFAQERLEALKKYELLGPEQLQEEELKQLQNLKDRELLTEKEYQKAKDAVGDKYREAAQEKDLEAIEEFIKSAQERLAVAQAAVSVIGDAVSALQDAAYAENDRKREEELGKLNEQYNREVAAAAGNEEKIKSIDEKYAKDKEKIEYDSKSKELEIQKQYADANFGMQVAQIIAATALGIITTWSTAMQLGPVAGPIAAGVLTGVIATTGALQVKAANEQRKAIKAQTLQAPSGGSGSSSSSGSSPRVVAAYAEGGYTGSGGMYEPAGVVHRGEYVVPQVVMRDPQAVDYVHALERIRNRKGLTDNKPKRGYASGGMVSDAPSLVNAVDTAALSELQAVVTELKEVIRNFPSRVYVTTDDISDGLSEKDRIEVRTNS